MSGPMMSQHLPPWRRQDTWREPLDRVAGMQYQTGSTSSAVLLPERAQVFRIAHTRPRAGLHFDWQQRAAGFDNEVHFLAGGGPPVEHLRAIQPAVPPRQQIVQDEILQLAAGRFLQARQMQR